MGLGGLVRWGIGWLLVESLGVWMDTLPAVAGEGVLLRWLRLVPEHPLRSSLAVALLLAAARPPKAAVRPARASPAAGSGKPVPDLERGGKCL